MRGPKERIKWFLNHPPRNSAGNVAAGQCLRHTWLATDIPAVGSPDADAAYRYVLGKGKLHRNKKAPVGAWMFWTGGSEGHGHVAIAMSGNRIASTDVNGPATTGVRPENWIEQNWGQHYEGWTDWYGVPFPVGSAWRLRIHKLKAQIGRIRKRH